MTLDNKEGIGEYKGYTLFVNNPPLRQSKSKSYENEENCFARLIEIIEPSPFRVNPKCKVADRCGGCSIQHVNYENSLKSSKAV